MFLHFHDMLVGAGLLDRVPLGEEEELAGAKGEPELGRGKELTSVGVKAPEEENEEEKGDMERAKEDWQEDRATAKEEKESKAKGHTAGRSRSKGPMGQQRKRNEESK